MPSLFRIDKSSINQDNIEKANMVVLPGFEDVVARNDQLKEKEETEAEQPVEVGETPEERSRRELAEIKAEIAQAKLEKERILKEAAQEAEGIAEAARQKGYKDGFDAAQASLMAQQIEEQRKIEDAVVALRDAREEIFTGIKDSVLDLSLFIAEYIIKTELDKNDEIFLNIVMNTLLTLKNQTNLTIRVSKEEYERFFSDPNSEIVRELSGSGIAVKQDIALSAGDVVVDTEYGTINAGIKTQLKRLSHALDR